MLKGSLKKSSLAPIILISSLNAFGCSSGGSGDPITPPASSWPEISTVRILTGFSSPLGITNAGDGSGRLFIVERGGKIWIVKGGTPLPTPFLDISDRVTISGGEQGLLGLAFPPDYTTKGHFYVNYTRSVDGYTIVARYLLTGDPDRADRESETVLLTVPQPFTNHNGGQLAFGADGYLYIGTGDGGSGGDPLNKAQDTGTLLGKLLRIDVESGDEPYGIPPDNPFINEEGALDEIWAFGLRNPWRFSFDSHTGELYTADVGQSSFEEVNVQEVSSTGGENYGWNIMEGSRCFGSPSCNQAGLTLPVVEYDHGNGNCSVTGGMVYRGHEFPEMGGIYFYGDFCSGRIWGLRKEGSSWENSLLIDSTFLISTFGEDEDGRLYVADFVDGDIYEIVFLK